MDGPPFSYPRARGPQLGSLYCTCSLVCFPSLPASLLRVRTGLDSSLHPPPGPGTERAFERSTRIWKR